MVQIVDFADEYKEKLFEIQDSVLLPNDKMTKAQFFDEFLWDTRKYFVALFKNEPVGFIGLYIYDDDLNIIQIAVDKAFQNRGIGGALLDKAKSFAKEMNKKSLSLEVDEKNILAQKFYQNNGFEVTNVRKNYYRTSDAIIMFCFL